MAFLILALSLLGGLGAVALRLTLDTRREVQWTRSRPRLLPMIISISPEVQ